MPSTDPNGALIGDYGGYLAELHATEHIVLIRYFCRTFVASGPIVPDAAGAFTLRLTPRPGNESRDAYVTATLSGRTIEMNATTMFPSGRADTARFTLRRSAEPDYSILSCLPPEVLPPR